MDSLEEDILSNSILKPLVWWRYIDDIFVIWEHGEEELQKFLETLNCYHPTIKFTAEYSRAKINFLDVTVIKKGNQLVTDLYIKPTDTHQYLHASSCHVSHCKKSIPFSQTLRLNRIFSENTFFDKWCNELEIWLKERGYSDKLVRGQILKARKFSRSEVLNKQKRMGNKSRIVFDITYHPVFSKLKNKLSEIHLLLTPDREHEKVFAHVPIIGFRRAKSLKDILVRAKVAPLEKKKGCCRPCGGTRCEICKHVVTTEAFRSFSTQREYCIKSNNLNCRSSNIVYLFSCKTCSKQYTGNTERFRSRLNNYKSAHRSFIKGNTVKQASFHAHFEDDKHHGISDWEITLIDQTDSVDNLRRRESFRQYELDTFQPNGLNERDVALF